MTFRCTTRQDKAKGINLRPGLNLLIDNYTLQDELVVDTRIPHADESYTSEFSFMICGNNTNEQVDSGQNFL
ncbi:hypothetical protein [Chroogloeocystis siderophila]|jgi:AraC family transcriptional activator of pyochelin receptor|uniref:Uncharacterized protein n=1 Tax=Chroogloeocystis siderophila 5.2 s.c.1 TaxID=247279 RepID=A0A1U7HZL4_9CHRO|nr:hypothetical protein [Chroogloeocystis siderophila]OKH29098.1 hypothetical protein NIES1031_00375 [Chroogloeocystis siderophila 5.2 s.c.1]